MDSDCDSNWTCINKICKIPCDRKFHGLCGANALCHTQGPSLICTCPDGYDGNAFVSCLPTNETKTENLCNSLSCGGNSKCDIINGKPSCFCLPDYHGSPPNCYQKNSTLLNTSSTCSINADCPLNEACIGNRCRDPCNDSICGINSECQIKNQVVSCKCRPNYTGNPFVECIEMSKPTVATTECQINSDCSPSTACINRKCVDPCFKACGREAICNVSNSLPVCSCPSNFSGDPYLECQPLETNKTTNSMCDEHTCGPNSQCNVGNGTITCSCLPGFSGNAPHCKEGCQLNSECASQLVCINRKCKDPCTIGICGLNTDCHVVNYTAVCECRKHYSGDPFIECFAISSKNQTESHNVCDAMPCGVNAVCHEKNGIVSCECMADYYGDPIEGCQPECTTNSDCPSTSACVKNKCQNPCSSACAENAKCIVLNHSPACTCAIGFTGDAKHNCTLIQAEQNRKNFFLPKNKTILKFKKKNFSQLQVYQLFLP